MSQYVFIAPAFEPRRPAYYTYLATVMEGPLQNLQKLNVIDSIIFYVLEYPASVASAFIPIFDSNPYLIMPTPTNQTAIPSVTNLREQLGYGDTKKKIFHELKTAMLSSRDVFVTDEGLRGQDLIDWKSREQQTALSKMVQTFLDRDRNAKKFWPDDDALYTTKLKFSTDQDR